MTIGISDEHGALHETARRWVETHAEVSTARAAMERGGELPPFWDDLAKMGWLGLHLPERFGGEGYGLPELVVVLEELGRARAPGPFVPTVLASTVIDAMGDDEQRARWLPGLADGSIVGAVALSIDDPVLGGDVASLFVVPVDTDDGGGTRWCVLDRDHVEPIKSASVDRTRGVARFDTSAVSIDDDRVLAGAPVVHELAATVWGAECVGGAAWCVDTASEYAKVRVQFGRPIGQFQAVKHRCADMLLRLELARAAVWDAARGDEAEGEHLATGVAGALAPEGFFDNAKDCIQVLGGIGFTWEHDAHLFLKRALVVRQVLGGAHLWHERVAETALRGTRRALAVELPDGANRYRDEVRAFLDEMRARDKAEWNRHIAESGYLVPYWPAPWGRDAGAVEQLVIDEEFAAARVRRPHLQVGAWVLPTLIAHGSLEQQERWILPTMRGEILWCQLFSEPGAGSDLASLSTRAERGEGGWLLTGQKVWTTMAHIADWGICLARTDADVPKHEGITCFMVDMRSPGIEVRPLRELTGAEMFNEVFFDEVFVPDDCVVGEVNHGWDAARTTLANERVSMGSGSTFGPGVEAVLFLAAERHPRSVLGADSVAGATESAPRTAGLAFGDSFVLDEVGALVAESHAIAVMALRSTLRALAGAEPGPEASVRKLLGVEHEQRVQEVGISLMGPSAAVDEGPAAEWIGGFLGNRALSIAGGTSDVQRNIIAERLLGLPKDP